MVDYKKMGSWKSRATLIQGLDLGKYLFYNKKWNKLSFTILNREIKLLNLLFILNELTHRLLIGYSIWFDK